MEGVGARLGRSSTRYGPATVFNGPVRKWKKRWVHVSPSATTNNNNSSHSQSHHHRLRSGTSNGATASTTNGNSSSHLLLYKWTPLTRRENNGNDDNTSDKDETAVSEAPEEPPRRKFKYIPIAFLEEERKEAEENEAPEKVENEAQPSDGGPIDVEPTPKNNGFDEKPDINDIPMEECQVNSSTILLVLDGSQCSVMIKLSPSYRMFGNASPYALMEKFTVL
ncbi:hypothetical protein HS088_TW09G00171 [Tripterygium wilfordii]|uniref:Uncharacterized protein n=1 Tax=Tripterygium wilfordii TaxID=458696 RepID=A0A7J7D7C2_TRIWF|nr:hypothetical protein HS088_TW09G00171 [Tripterygium wilfordii]